MTKVVYNDCYGGFGLSQKAITRYAELKGLTLESRPSKFISSLKHYSRNGEYWSNMDIPRHDPALVQVVEELGEQASGQSANLQIKEIEGNQYRIEEYDGAESVQEPKDIEWINVT